jgi:hypothetical protein
LNSLPDARVGVGGSALPTQQHVIPALFPSVLPASSMPAVSPRYDMQAGMPRGFPQLPHHQQPQRQHDNQQSMLMGQSMLREQQRLAAGVRTMNGIGGIPHHGGHYRPRPDSHPFHGANTMGYPSGMQNPAVLQNQQRALHVHQQSAFHVSDQKQFRHNPLPDMGMGGRFHPSYDSGGGNVVDLRAKAGNFVPQGVMWSGRTPPPFVPAADASRLMRHSSVPENSYQHNSMPVPSRQARTTAAGLGLGFGTLPPLDPKEIGRDPAPVPALKSAGKDDSRMVDSLFGPSSESGNEEKNLLPGFQGLSLEEGLGGDTWSKNLSQNWDEEPKGSSALFAAIKPSLGPNDMAHPSRSRFVWGAQSESQGQSS